MFGDMYIQYLIVEIGELHWTDWNGYTQKSALGYITNIVGLQLQFVITCLMSLNTYRLQLQVYAD